MENFIFYAEDAKRKIVDKKQCKERESIKLCGLHIDIDEDAL